MESKKSERSLSSEVAKEEGSVVGDALTPLFLHQMKDGEARANINQKGNNIKALRMKTFGQNAPVKSKNSIRQLLVEDLR